MHVCTYVRTYAYFIYVSLDSYFNMFDKKVRSGLTILILLSLPLSLIIPVQAVYYDVYVKWDGWNLLGADYCGDGVYNDCEWDIYVQYCGDGEWIRWTWIGVDLDESDYTISYAKGYEDTCSHVTVTIYEHDFMQWNAISSSHTFIGIGTWNNYELNQNRDIGFAIIDITISIS